MSTEIFKAGDPVFDHIYKWGEIIEINNHSAYPMTIRFGGKEVYYKEYDTLSFTEYDLINGGWSQDRSVLNQPKKGGLVYVRDNEDENWQMRFYSHYESRRFYVFADQSKSGAAVPYVFLEVENPLLKGKE